MKCEDCKNYETDGPMEYGKPRIEQCQNFKAKVHPLDELIEDIVCTSLNGRLYAPLKKDLKKLRHESFIEGWHACNCDSAYSFPGEYLMANDLGNWIPEDSK